MLCHRHKVHIILNNRQGEFNVQFHIKVDDFHYIVYATSETMRCFGYGHVRSCPEKVAWETPDPGEGISGQSGTGGTGSEQLEEQQKKQETNRQTQSEQTIKQKRGTDNTVEDEMTGVADDVVDSVLMHARDSMG